MCVLCSGFVVQEHWTDARRHRQQDGSTVTVGGSESRDRRRERWMRMKLANAVLQVCGLKLDDWNGSKYILRDVKGAAEIVQDWGELWPAVQKLLRRPLDPLDADFLARLKAAGRRS
jgi:hypothetical protein